MLLSSTKLDQLALKSLESWTWSEILSTEIIKFMWEISWKILLHLVLTGDQASKIIVLPYVGRVSGSLAKETWNRWNTICNIFSTKTPRYDCCFVSLTLFIYMTFKWVLLSIFPWTQSNLNCDKRGCILMIFYDKWYLKY